MVSKKVSDASSVDASEIVKPKRTRKPAATKTTVKAAPKKPAVKKKPVKQPMPVYEIIDTDYENPWYYKGEIFNSTNINGAHGMIYLIEEISTGRLYIGQKQLWTKKPRMVNKKKKMIKAESDWKKYFSSSNYIIEKVEKEGSSDFKRYVIALVSSDGMLNYLEMKIQMDVRVLENADKFINGYIGGKISRSHVSMDKIIEIDEELMKYIYAK